MEVAGLVVGVIALVLGIMAIPTILQMLLGRPKLTFEADEFTGSEAKILIVAIKNQPIKNWFLRLIRVEREIGDVTAFFDIVEQGTKRIIVRAIFGKLNCAVTREEGLLVRARPGFTVGLPIIGTKDGAASIVDGRAEDLRPISEGHYTAIISIIRGEQTTKLCRPFALEQRTI